MSRYIPSEEPTTTSETGTPKVGLDAITDPNLLAAHLLRKVSHNEPHHLLYTGQLRASSLYKVCLREEVIGYFHKLKRAAYWNPALQLTFDIGHAIHHRIQNSDMYFGDRRWGTWRCTACKKKVKRGHPPKRKTCQHCGASIQAVVYEEHGFNLKSPYYSSGHVDLVLRVADHSLRIGDIKSISRDDFKVLTEPKADHVIQVVDYMMQAEWDGTFPEDFDYHRGLLIYVAKEFIGKGMMPIKVFHVFRDPYVERTIVSLRSTYTSCIKSKELPDTLDECTASDWGCYRAVACPGKKLCRRYAEG